MRDKSSVVRAGITEIAGALFDDKPKQLRPFFDQAIADPDAKVRLVAVDLVSEMYPDNKTERGFLDLDYFIDRDGIAVLIDLAKEDPSPKVRMKAYEILAQTKMGEHDLVPIFNWGLADSNHDVRFKVTLFANKLSNAEQVRFYRKVIRTQNKEIARNTLANAIDGFGTTLSETDKQAVLDTMLERTDFRKDKDFYEAASGAKKAAVPTLLKAWSYRDTDTKVLALRYAAFKISLDGIDRNSFKTMIDEARASKDPEILAALTKDYDDFLPKEEHQAFIESMLSHPHSKVRAAAYGNIRALKSTPDKMQAAYEKGLKESNAEVQTEAFRGLIYSCYGKDECVDRLIREGWKTQNLAVRKEALSFIHESEPERVNAFLDALLEGSRLPDQEASARAQRIWANTLANQGPEIVMSAASREPPVLRQELIKVADQVVSPSQVSELLLSLVPRETHSEVKIAAMHALSRLPLNQSTHTLLILGEQDSDPKVRLAASSARRTLCGQSIRGYCSYDFLNQ